MLPITPELCVDWNGDGWFAGPNEDLTSQALTVQWQRGRSAVNDEFTAGTLMAELDNSAGLFSPFNAGGALYGQLLPGRAVRFRVTHNAITYPEFYGYLTDIRETRTPDGRPSVSISAMDGLDLLRLGSIRIALQENKRVDQLLTAILDAAGWDAGLRDLDVALTTVDQFWVYRSDPLSALRLAAKQELGHGLFMDTAGRVRFQNRDFRSSQALYATFTGVRSLSMEIRRDQMYDEVHHTWAGLSADAANTVLFTLSPAGRRLEPGTAAPLNTIHGDFNGGAASVVTPAPITDYAANSEPDGSGTDKTAQVVVDSFTSYGGGFSVTFEVLDSSPVYLTFLQARGLAIRTASDERMIEVPVAAPLLTGQVLSDSFEFNNDAEAVAAYAHWRSAVFSQIRPRPTVEIIPRDDAEMASVLGAELSDRVRIANTTGLYPTQMDGEFVIEGIRMAVQSGQLVTCQWNLFDRDQAMGSFWRISSDDNSAEYSVVSADAATSGDRIAV